MLMPSTQETNNTGFTTTIYDETIRLHFTTTHSPTNHRAQPPISTVIDILTHAGALLKEAHNKHSKTMNNEEGCYLIHHVRNLLPSALGLNKIVSKSCLSATNPWV